MKLIYFFVSLIIVVLWSNCTDTTQMLCEITSNNSTNPAKKKCLPFCDDNLPNGNIKDCVCKFGTHREGDRCLPDCKKNGWCINVEKEKLNKCLKPLRFLWSATYYTDCDTSAWNIYLSYICCSGFFLCMVAGVYAVYAFFKGLRNKPQPIQIERDYLVTYHPNNNLNTNDYLCDDNQTKAVAYEKKLFKKNENCK